MTSFRSISAWDDYPVHQTSEYVRHPATSDRNFYDRYYFNLHPSTSEYFAVFGLGQYPNLGTTDAYLAVTTGDDHLVVRARWALAGPDGGWRGPPGRFAQR